MPENRLSYRHVDVFAERRFSGNGLTVFPHLGDLTAAVMQAITIEMRQFETIFLRTDPERSRAEARVFTMEEELPFAGHPALGAACVLHERYCPDDPESRWTLAFPGQENALTVTRRGESYQAVMDQGAPTFGPRLAPDTVAPIVAALSLSPDDLDPACPPQVVSTGLPYLILPLRRKLEHARIRRPDLEELLGEIGADFVYVLETDGREGRTWDNAGRVEDIATGSAAGPAGAFLVAHGRAPAGDWFEIRQGRFVGRPSVIRVGATATDDGIAGVEIMGSVVMVARGTLDAV
ncbi:MAG: PhzF family phenazine biosynthesis protein [Alphaproteobacteria bacterium]|nr:PhzF family phenazine biosynthesis protein [Alphaproteobacteria bacterium]